MSPEFLEDIIVRVNIKTNNGNTYKEFHLNQEKQTVEEYGDEIKKFMEEITKTCL